MRDSLSKHLTIDSDGKLRITLEWGSEEVSSFIVTGVKKLHNLLMLEEV